ncbi:unnamed protein product [Cuscuta epithymum]|uniref:Uncharacterized protein n=1 Tax=Cuscuta epithymum TaxID=186058 RepID=A0AAV0EHF9_9ASTE|nr:unnamed protein product [Cuscuta epithymum]
MTLIPAYSDASDSFDHSDDSFFSDNLNTQLKIYKKSQKNKRRHSTKTRSQSKKFPWV